MSTGLVTCEYSGPFEGHAQGRTLKQGDLIDVPAHQAESTWFTPVKRGRPVKAEEE